MLEEYGFADPGSSCGCDVHLVALVVFIRVSNVVSTSRVFCPRFTGAWHHVGFDFASQRCKWITVVIVLSVQVRVC